MSYFPTDIPFMSEEELKANGIKVNCSEKPNNSKLARCPFCDKEAKVKVYNYAKRARCADGEEPYFVVTYKIGCFDCGVTFAYETEIEAKENGSIEIVTDGYRNAADRWNRRGEK